jgi:hypothetical protein
VRYAVVIRYRVAESVYSRLGIVGHCSIESSTFFLMDDIHFFLVTTMLSIINISVHPTV